MIKKKSSDETIRWSPDGLGWICPHCGASNPDGGNRCGNCDENPFIFPKDFLNQNQLLTLNAIRRFKS